MPSMVGAMSCSAPSGRSVKRRGSPLKFAGVTAFSVHTMNGTGLRGVRRLRAASRGIDHLLGVAMVAVTIMAPPCCRKAL